MGRHPSFADGIAPGAGTGGIVPMPGTGGTALLSGVPHRFGHLLPGPGTGGATSCVLGPDASSVKQARDHACRTVDRWNMSLIREDVGLVVSELVTNALRHGISTVPAPTPVALMLLRSAPHLLCVVTDPGSRVPRPREPGLDEEHGRGLHVVAAYSRRWGWDPLDNGGKAVWALFSAL